MKTFKQLRESLKNSCWKGYEAIGMKKKNGKTVPNCVPTKEEVELDEMDNRTSSGDRQEQRVNSPEEKAKRKKEFQNNLKTAGSYVRKRLRLPGPKESVAEEVEQLSERGEDSKGYYRSTESGAGLTAKGAKAMGVKTAVTTPPSKLDPECKAAKRRKSFCARMSGMKGPMKDEKGRPTRKAMSLRRWNCH